MPQRPKLLNEVRKKIRLKHDSIRTEETHLNWVRRCILFHNKRHPREVGIPEIEEFFPSTGYAWLFILALCEFRQTLMNPES